MILKEWRANLAAHDILKKKAYDSLCEAQAVQIDYLNERVEKQQLVINDYADISRERLEMIDLMEEKANLFATEAQDLKKDNRKIRKQRNLIGAIAGVLLILIAIK